MPSKLNITIGNDLTFGHTGMLNRVVAQKIRSYGTASSYFDKFMRCLISLELEKDFVYGFHGSQWFQDFFEKIFTSRGHYFKRIWGIFATPLSWHSLMFPHSWGCNRLQRALVLFEMFCPSLKRRSSTRLRWEFCCFLCKCSEMCWSRQKRGGQGVSWVGSKPNTWASPNPTWASRYLESQMLTTCGCCVPLPTNAVHGTLTPCRFQGFCRLSSVDLGW